MFSCGIWHSPAMWEAMLLDWTAAKIEGRGTPADHRHLPAGQLFWSMELGRVELEDFVRPPFDVRNPWPVLHAGCGDERSCFRERSRSTLFRHRGPAVPRGQSRRPADRVRSSALRDHEAGVRGRVVFASGRAQGVGTGVPIASDGRFEGIGCTRRGRGLPREALRPPDRATIARLPPIAKLPRC